MGNAVDPQINTRQRSLKEQYGILECKPSGISLEKFWTVLKSLKLNSVSAADNVICCYLLIKLVFVCMNVLHIIQPKQNKKKKEPQI